MIYRVLGCLLAFLPVSIIASWAEKTLDGLSLDEKIGQLFIIPACPLRGEDHLQDLTQIIKKHHIGGIIPKQGDPKGQVGIINTLQAISSIPLLCVMDAEWGLSMRLTDTLRFPKNLTLGAIQDTSLIYKLGKEIGRQCRKVGAHLPLGPVVDVNNNSQNPIIHMRSFGEDPKRVAECSVAMMKGMQEAGVLACAKHFPGHGDTAVDSHQDLPLIKHSLMRLCEIELYPFQKMIDAGVDVVMTAHLAVPCLEEVLPSSLSSKVITTLLKQKMGFNGLVISDALNMKALTLYFSEEEVALKAFLSGTDLLLYGDHIAPNIDRILRNDVPKAIGAIKKAYEDGVITEAELNKRVLKVLQAKEKLGLTSKITLPEPNLEDLNSEEALALKKELFRQAVTVTNNQEGILPLKKNKVALLHIGNDKSFSIELSKYAQVDAYSFEERSKLLEQGTLPIIVALYDIVSNAKTHFGITDEVRTFLQELSKTPFPVILVLFGTPYALAEVPSFPGMIVAYENEPESQEAAASIIMGRLVPKGKLPISATDAYTIRTGLSWD